MLNLPVVLQAEVLSEFSGVAVSVSTTARRAAEYRKQLWQLPTAS
jgi:hypothetical protein